MSGPAGSPYRVVLTTRPIGGAALAPLQRAMARYELQPFDEEALRHFAENWFAEEGSDTAHRLLRQIREAHLDELVQVPLLATIAAIIFEQHNERPLPDNQYELHQEYLAYLRSARTPVPGAFEHLGTRLLEHLGRVRLETDTSLVAAARLANLGIPGREGPTAALRSITADDTLPVTARAEAARLLAEIRPSSLGEALTVLHGLIDADNPLHRRQVLLAMGSLDTTEAVPPLRAMMHDRTLGPVVRLRCAEALAQLRRDQRETASVVARELMRDEAVPRHVRSRAARDLAHWSELCRQEARDLLLVLHPIGVFSDPTGQ